MSRADYFNLSIPASRRLAMMRADFENHVAKYPHCPEACRPKTWRDVRGFTLKNWQRAFITLDAGRDDDMQVWYTHVGPEFRGERFADDVQGSYVMHQGWYTDGVEFGETVRGIVARLPHGRFLAGYYRSENGERVYFSEVFADEVEAARYGDRQAESIGERDSAEHEKFREAQNLEDEIDDQLKRLRECLALRHRACMEYVRDEIAELVESIRAKRETMATDFKGVL